MTDNSAAESIFGPVIYSYSRAQAIADGVLVDVSDTAQEAGFVFPVAVTDTVWADCIAWSQRDNVEKRCYQDEPGRLWDVLHMARLAIEQASHGQVLEYELYRVPRAEQARRPEPVKLKLVCGPGDDGEAVITIMFPHED
ncbi:MAG TPA: DUF6573 family protein [Gammaproteobacteria bacterium]|nr:DUF6573 family protein [Gammaproteobacteria bacterium]